MRLENLIPFSSWEARLTGTSNAGVLVKYSTIASIFHLNFRKFRREGFCLKFFMIPESCHLVNAKMPRCQDAKMPRYQDAKMPRCQNAMMPR